MSKRHAKCSVVGCKAEHKTLHCLPAENYKRAAWIEFIFDGKVPATFCKKLFVCANHFEANCFSNLGQYKAGLVERLHLNSGAYPTLRGIPVDGGHVTQRLQQLPEPSCMHGGPSWPGTCLSECIFTEEGTEHLSGRLWTFTSEGNSASTAASTCPISPTVRDVACQTDPPKRISVGTQLSMKTLQSHFRSKGVQAKAASRDFGVCTLTFPLDSPLLFLQPTIVKRPSKRPRLSLTDEGEGPCLSMVVNESDDSI